MRQKAAIEISAPRLAWLAFGLVVLLYLSGLLLSLLNRSLDALLIAFLLFPIVGAPIASRHPRHPIGWILLGLGASWALFTVLNAYAVYALVTKPGSLPRPDLVLALNSWTWIPAVGLMGTFLILLFPNGRLPSRRWRPLAWISAISMVGGSVASLILPGPFANSGFPNVTNPLGVERLSTLIEALAFVSVVALLACIVGSTVGAIQRFRRSRGTERLQLKWLVTAAATAAGAYLVLMATAAFVHLMHLPTSALWLRVMEQIALSSFVLIPVAVGIAIFRYRLYDIDVIINRTLVYASLTAVLALVYALGVLGAGTLVREATGQETNNLAVAASTLAVAALFRPARARIQSFIDRRFYRRKYDATRTVEEFSERLRAQVDLEELTSELVIMVRGTIQPAHLSVWLRR